MARATEAMHWEHAGHACTHRYLLPEVERVLAGLGLPEGRKRIFDLGCGNGSAAAALQARGYEMAGVDPSPSGIAQARAAHPGLALAVGSTDDDLAAIHGRFPVVISLEVVEHVYAPRRFARRVWELLEDGGTAIVSTPYHGYWKNLALAVTGRMDRHFTALWDHGHIKFFSRATLRLLLEEAGFVDVRIVRVGRIPPLARSMIAVARRPAAS
jgi:2-polyprenyl-6-hydroxyphenyl methylase/3-demethylubiquinone-9 3-methyltransferase